MSVGRFGIAFVVVACLAGCERDPLECPGVSPGSLVVTEISGSDSTSPLGEWIELYNASGATIELLGVRVEFTTLDGGNEQEFTIRRAFNVAAGAYVTLGRHDDTNLPAGIDYGYQEDLDASFFDIAAVEIVVCGEEVDQAVYRGLPDTGTLALDGASEPSATFNDTEDNFCVDDQGGTPGAENPPCA